MWKAGSLAISSFNWMGMRARFFRCFVVIVVFNLSIMVIGDNELIAIALFGLYGRWDVLRMRNRRYKLLSMYMNHQNNCARLMRCDVRRGERGMRGASGG